MNLRPLLAVLLLAACSHGHAVPTPHDVAREKVEWCLDLAQLAGDDMTNTYMIGDQPDGPTVSIAAPNGGAEFFTVEQLAPRVDRGGCKAILP